MLRALGMALLCLAALAPTRVAAEAPTVVVRRGDSLIVIAKRANVSVAELKRWNGLRGDMIRIGQELVIRPRGVGRAPNDEGIDWTPPFDHGAKDEKPAHSRSAPIAARDPSSAVAARPTDAAKPEKKRGRTYRVQKGDTLNGGSGDDLLSNR